MKTTSYWMSQLGNGIGNVGKWKRIIVSDKIFCVIPQAPVVPCTDFQPLEDALFNFCRLNSNPFNSVSENTSQNYLLSADTVERKPSVGSQMTQVIRESLHPTPHLGNLSRGKHQYRVSPILDQIKVTSSRTRQCFRSHSRTQR